MSTKIENEKKLVDFYQEMVKMSQVDLNSLKNFFEIAFTSMVISHEFNDKKFGNREAYEMLFMLCLSVNNKELLKDGNFTMSYPFSIVDDGSYYVKHVFDNHVLLKDVLTLIRLHGDVKKGERNTDNWRILKNDFDGVVKTYKEMVQLETIFRNGWIRRDVPKEYYESDAVHSAQMFGFASAFMTLMKPEDLDYNKVLEMILIHEVGELIAGDITELETGHDSKHEIEKMAVMAFFGNLNSGDYFINLWNEFEERKSNEARFVYELDKFDPIAKARYLDDELGRDDLLIDFYQYEEKRNTFEHSSLKKVFNYVGKEINEKNN